MINFFANSVLNLRRRSVWEAADSGLLLWRDSFVYLIPFFAIPFWITAFGILFLIGENILVTCLVLWWLKPLFDRIVLHVISKKFFHSGDFRKESSLRFYGRGLWGTIRRGLLGDLLWRRFSPGRGARMPIRTLEQIENKQYRQRKKALATGGLNFCFLISILGLFLEGILLLGESLFGVLTLQLISPDALDFIWEYTEITGMLIFAAYCFNYIIVESLYVCMGFGLYINSRVEVEGWDLQFLFHKFAGSREKNREPAIKKPSSTIKKILTAGVFLGLLAGPVSYSAHAEENYIDLSQTEFSDNTENIDYFPTNFPSLGADQMEMLEEILASRDFGYARDGWEIRLRQPLEPIEPNALDHRPWIDVIQRIFGYLLRIIAAIFIAFILGLIIYLIGKYWPGFSWLKTKKEGILFSEPKGNTGNAEDYFLRAEEYYRQGNLREAWAACLSGYIGSYRQYYSIFFPSDATEYGCLALLRKTLPDEADRFRDFIHNWIPFAYGGKYPAQEAFAKAIDSGRSIKTIHTGDSLEP